MFNSSISGNAATGATLATVRPWPAWTDSQAPPPVSPSARPAPRVSRSSRPSPNTVRCETHSICAAFVRSSVDSLVVIETDSRECPLRGDVATDCARAADHSDTSSPPSVVISLRRSEPALPVVDGDAARFQHLVGSWRSRVEERRHASCERLHISVLYVAAVLAKMRGIPSAPADSQIAAASPDQARFRRAPAQCCT